MPIKILVFVCPSCLDAYYGRLLTAKEVIHFEAQVAYGYEKYSVSRCDENVFVTVKQECTNCDS